MTLASAGALVLSPLRIERWALGRVDARVERFGMGPTSARSAAIRLASDAASHVYVVGFAGALDGGLPPGEVFVADAVLAPVDDGSPRDPVACDHTEAAAALRDAGLPVTVGSLISSGKVVTGSERARFAESGARAVDMESYWLAPLAVGRAWSVIRVIVDTPSRELFNPLRTMVSGVRGLRVLRRVAEALFSSGEAK